MLFSHDTCWFLSSLFPCLKVWRDQTLACDAIGMFLCPSDGHKWALFQYKSSFSMYSNCPCGDKTVRMSYLYHNGNFSPCGMTALYWNRALVSRWLRHMAWWSLLKLQSWWWVGVGGVHLQGVATSNHVGGPFNFFYDYPYSLPLCHS